MQFSTEVQAALQKIKGKFGFKVTAEGLVSCTTGQKVRRSADIEKASLVLESMADTSIEQIAGMMRREQRDADGEAVVVPQTLIPVLDGRLARPEANKLDRDLFHSLRVPYAEDREARTIAREEGCLVYVEGHKATRVASECLRVALPREIVEEIDTKASAYREQANAALIRIAAECTRGGEPAHVHQRLAEWVLENVPTAMIPDGKPGLQIRAIRRGRGDAVPQEIIGWADPIDALEKKKSITQNPSFFVKNLASISNDPDELAITHIDLGNLPDGDTPAWAEMAAKFPADEWAVLCAYVYATFDMKNNSRQALILYDNGHTGKSTLFNVISWALGGRENCAFPDPLLSPKDDKFYTSQYYGKHAVFIPDCKNPNLLRTGWIHSYTGGDVVSVQYKGRNAFSARCYGKAYIATNALPSLDVQAEHIKTRLIILRPTLTEEALERLGQRDTDGNLLRDEQGKVLIKGDPLFETHLKEQFWAFLKQCKTHYNALCPDGCTIQLPQSVRENAEIAEDFVTTQILERAESQFIFGPDKRCFAKELAEFIEAELPTLPRGVDAQKILQILAENRGVTRKRSMRIGEQVTSGYVGLEPRVRGELNTILDPTQPMISFEGLDLSGL